MQAPPRPGVERWQRSSRLIVLQSEMRDLLFAHQMTQRVLEFRLLNEEIVLGLKAWRGHRALVEEREPLLNALEAGALREIAEQREICLLYTSPSPRDRQKSRMPSSA